MGIPVAIPCSQRCACKPSWAWRGVREMGKGERGVGTRLKLRRHRGWDRGWAPVLTTRTLYMCVAEDEMVRVFVGGEAGISLSISLQIGRLGRGQTVVVSSPQAQSQMSSQTAPDGKKMHVIIIGSGCSGLFIAQGLKKVHGKPVEGFSNSSRRFREASPSASMTRSIPRFVTATGA